MAKRQGSRTRPPIERIKSAAEFRRWYWLKSELVAFARTRGIATTGQKPELAKRVAAFIDTGHRLAAPKKKRIRSDFDWRTSSLRKSTVITDSYRNTQNVRSFMKKHAGEKFRFSNEFMAWMRANEGKTLGDAVMFWRELDRKKREEGYREASLPQNQYAQFSRALAEARPGIKAADIRRIWKIKRSGPGPFRYRKGDENL
ncbi:MAG: DUF6434 domain-containing protein [Myxococcota bacterium]